jgi:hypothetical protein
MAEPIAWLVEYETVNGWEGEGENRHKTWTAVKLATAERHEVDAVAENPMYCRNKRVTPLVAIARSHLCARDCGEQQLGGEPCGDRPCALLAIPPIDAGSSSNAGVLRTPETPDQDVTGAPE